MFAIPSGLSPKRYRLCSRENANRVATKLFDSRPGRVSVVRTSNLLQPFCVSESPALDDLVEVEIVS